MGIEHEFSKKEQMNKPKYWWLADRIECESNRKEILQKGLVTFLQGLNKRSRVNRSQRQIQNGLGADSYDQTIPNPNERSDR